MEFWDILLGKLGHLFNSLAFASSFVSALAFLLFDSEKKTDTNKIGTFSFNLHFASILLAFVTLLVIIITHSYQYFYAWDHSSNQLPLYYVISCIWEGQEGSFLIWIFWQGLIGVWILRKEKTFSTSSLGILSLIQFLLISMVLGIFISKFLLLGISILSATSLLFLFGRKSVSFAKILPFLVVSVLLAFFALLAEVSQIKLGSSPFILLSETFPNAAVFKTNPDFVPKDGKGLNPLLQNYWMVIHPPTLFLGFALSAIPFVNVMGNLIDNNLASKNIISLKWISLSAFFLGLGIIMGAYWAYETLNFGGYWNWDPVENASLVPWIINIAALHSVLITRKTGQLKLSSVLLIIGTYFLVLYSTFLTRSGILGDASVHSFTDLGMSGQLLFFVFSLIILGMGILIIRNKNFKAPNSDFEIKSATFFLFMGVLLLTLCSFIISFSTSFPVFNKIFGTNLAAPPNIPFFYYKWVGAFTICIPILFLPATFLFWKSPILSKDKKFPLILGLLGLLILVILAATFLNKGFVYGPENGYHLFWEYLSWVMIYASLVGFFGGIYLLVFLLKKGIKKFNMAGTMAHLGFSILIPGIILSSGYELPWILDSTEDSNFQSEKDNILLLKNQKREVQGHKISYLGRSLPTGKITEAKIEDFTADQIRVSFLDSLNECFRFVFSRGSFPYPSKDHSIEGEDLIEFIEENHPILPIKKCDGKISFEIEVEKDGSTYTLEPDAHIDEQNGLLAHPARRVELTKDIYLYVSALPAPLPSFDEYKRINIRLKEGSRLKSSGLLLKAGKVMKMSPSERWKSRISVDLDLSIGDTIFQIHPQLRISNDQTLIPKLVYIPEIFSAIYLSNWNPETEELVFDIFRPEKPIKDFVTLKVTEKPFINLVWLGTILLLIGFIFSIKKKR